MILPPQFLQMLRQRQMGGQGGQMGGFLGSAQGAQVPQTQMPQAMGPFSMLAYQMGGAPHSMNQWPPPGFGGPLAPPGGHMQIPQQPQRPMGWPGNGLLSGGSY